MNYFKLKENGTNVRTEIIAGCTTFMTMAYILLVNQFFLGPAGVPSMGIFFATAVGAGLVTIAMGLIVNIPVASAPGMGLNAYFMSVVLSRPEITWQIALGAVFISGIVFILLTVTKVRQMLIRAVPQSLQAAITVGIGLFLSIVALKLGNVIQITVNDDTVANAVVNGGGYNLQFGNLATNPDTLLTIIGLLVVALLMVLNIKGALLIGIVITTLIGIPLGVTDLSGLSQSWIPSFEGLSFGQLDIGGAFGVGFIEIIFVFTFVELFDGFGTLVGTTRAAGILDRPDGEKKLGKAMLVDAVGVSAGAVLGTSTVTVFAESTSGVEAGGRTGLTSVTTGILFLLALFIYPLTLVVPSAATSGALVVVGIMMMKQIRLVDWNDFLHAAPAFLTMVFMPFTYSIANGISIGIISFVLLTIVAKIFGKTKERIHPLMWILFVIVLVRYIWFFS